MNRGSSDGIAYSVSVAARGTLKVLIRHSYDSSDPGRAYFNRLGLSI